MTNFYFHIKAITNQNPMRYDKNFFQRVKANKRQPS
jgi:hypothetical protein